MINPLHISQTLKVTVVGKAKAGNASYKNLVFWEFIGI